MSPARHLESRFPAPQFPGAQFQRSVRGFTLIELMVTVVIISVIAALATPGILARVNSYKARSAAELLASTYRLARLRAMGRGSAVLVRFNAGDITVLEGIQGPAASHTGCAQLPAPSCTTPVTRFDAGSETFHQAVESYDVEGTSYTVTHSLGTLADVCFTPLGRAYSRATPTGAFNLLLTPTTLAVSPGAGGLVRQVLILPSGTARVVAGAL